MIVFHIGKSKVLLNICRGLFMNCDDDFKYRKDKTIEAWNRRAGEKK